MGCHPCGHFFRHSYWISTWCPGLFDLSCVIHCIHFCSVTFKLTTQPFVRDSWVCVRRDSMRLQIRRGGFYLALKPVSFGSENDADLGRAGKSGQQSYPTPNCMSESPIGIPKRLFTRARCSEIQHLLWEWGPHIPRDLLCTDVNFSFILAQFMPGCTDGSQMIRCFWLVVSGRHRYFKVQSSRPGAVGYTYNLSAWKVEAGG